MFRSRIDNRHAVDLGELDPWQLSGTMSELLRELVKVSPQLEPGVHQAVITNRDGYSTRYSLRLKFPLAYRGELDPSVTNSDSSAPLAALLERVNSRGLCTAGLQCIRNHQTRKIDVYDLKYTVIARNKFSKTTYYDLLGSGIVGEGAFGTVRPIIGTLKPRFGNADDLYFSPSENKRVIKIMRDDLFDDDSNPRIEKEVRLMQKAGYFKVREKLNLQEGVRRTHFISMKRFPWVGLHRIVAMDKNNKINLTIDDRLQLTIRMLRELKRKLHGKQIIHRDIKPDNIHVNKDKITKLWEVYFIDLGLSAIQGDHAPHLVGTPYYMAPELINRGKYSEASDLYALARSIGELWRDKELKSSDPATTSWQSFARKRSTERDINYQLFHDLNMPADMSVEIEKAIRWISSFDKECRPSIDDAIDRFESIRLNYVLKKMDDKTAIKVRCAHQLAMSTAAKLEQYANDSLCANSEKMFRNYVFESIKSLSDQALAIRIFVETLGIKCLYACANVGGLMAKVSEILDGFNSAKLQYEREVNNLEAVKARVHGQDVKAENIDEYMVLCKRFYDLSCDKPPLDLDALVEITKRIKAKTRDVSEAVLYYSETNKDNLVPNNKIVFRSHA